MRCGRVKDNDWTSVRKAIQILSSELAPTASPTFAGIGLSGLTASRLLSTSASKSLASVSDLTAWVAGTTNRVTVADDGDGTVTLNGPQDIHTAATPTFAGLIIGNGGTIGQAAGPLLTFNDTINILLIDGCFVGMGVASPNDKLHINGPLWINPGSNTWGSLLVLKADEEAGGVQWSIFSTTNAAGEGGGKLIFKDSANRMLFDGSGGVTIPAMSSAGFVKNSAAGLLSGGNTLAASDLPWSTTVTGLTYTSATGVLSLTSGYVIPTTTEETNWNTAYGWGNHASGGYFVKATDDLDDISAGVTNVHLTTTLKTNYDAAYTHVSNNGTDHSYINQSVTTTANPQFATQGIGAAAKASALLQIGSSTTTIERISFHPTAYYGLGYDDDVAGGVVFCYLDSAWSPAKFSVGTWNGSAYAEKISLAASGTITATALTLTDPVTITTEVETILASIDTSSIRATWTSYSGTASHSPQLISRHAGGTEALPTVTQSGDKLGAFLFYGYSGVNSAFKAAVKIEAYAAAEWDSGGDTTDNPGYLSFWTCPDGGNVPAERLRLTSEGDLGLNTTTPALINDGAELAVIASSGESGNIDVGSATPSPGDGAGTGSYNWWASGQSASHQRIAYIYGDLDGGTANQRGGRLTIATKADAATSGTARITVRSDGKVGIGTASPNEVLEVAGKIRANTAFNLNGSDGISSTLTLDDGANWRITMTFTGGILTAKTTGASVAATATWS